MSLYAYCVMEEPNLPASLPAGIQDQPVRILEAESFRVVASEFAGAELKPSKENLIAHERAIEAFMDTTTPLPFRFGTVIGEHKLVQFCRTREDVLKSDFEKVRGCVEMGLKVIIALKANEIAVSPRDEDKGIGMGTRFLKAKQQRLDVQKEVARWVEEAVAGLVRMSEVSIMSNPEKPIIRIAQLVTRYHLVEYKTRIDALVRQRTDCAFLRSGPWPPYSFVSTPRLG